MFLVYVTIVFCFGSTTNSSTMHTNFPLKNLSPHFGTRLVLVNNRLECNFPSFISRQSVSSVRTCELIFYYKRGLKVIFCLLQWSSLVQLPIWIRIFSPEGLCNLIPRIIENEMTFVKFCHINSRLIRFIRPSLRRIVLHNHFVQKLLMKKKNTQCGLCSFTALALFSWIHKLQHLYQQEP